MLEPNLPFERVESDHRISRTRAAMSEAGLDLIVVSDPSNMAWLSGYDGWSFYTHQAVILGHEGAPVWWGRGMDAAGGRRRVWGEDADHLVQNPDAYLMH